MKSCIFFREFGWSLSIVQGSVVGPVAHVINAGNLVAVTPGNRICNTPMIPTSSCQKCWGWEHWTVGYRQQPDLKPKNVGQNDFHRKAS